ncbi:amidinotransferase [Elizabethkingia argentiflava]|uniref:arginine deiminase n=1 Tax=Elizabethkingia argenteiflava TaxID=2681556 RepID=A0A845Q0E1_9FLAO|nr:arginine deiminase family protein [Elizabethkingia argenteiflava]NAW52098.1 amidinotransferase [Elizabethkingia argenteiflava]
MKLNITNETGRLRCVVLGQPMSIGDTPQLNDSYDAKSYQSIKKGIYPTEADIVSEMSAFEKVLHHYNVQILYPENIQNYNQIFARDTAFVIDDKVVVANIIEERAAEQQAYRKIFEEIPWRNIINLPERAHVEGGDIILCNDFLFIGTCYSSEYGNFKTARTNPYAIEVLKEYFPHKKIIDLDLKKDDKNPDKGILHLDCTFNPIGRDKCIIYKEGFVKESDYYLLLDIFGKENCFSITTEEMMNMTPNIFSIDYDVVVSDSAFHRLNQHLRQEWNFRVEEISYREISKMGGLLRCSTLPLVRES